MDDDYQCKRSKRQMFSLEEDKILSEQVRKHGERDWSIIASKLPGRTARQCRERWQNNLARNIIKNKWTEQEDELLKMKYNEFGPRWKFLEQFFPGRTSYNIRNRWQCKMRLWNLYSAPFARNEENIYSKVINQPPPQKVLPMPILNNSENDSDFEFLNDENLENQFYFDDAEENAFFNDLFFDHEIMNA